ASSQSVESSDVAGNQLLLVALGKTLEDAREAVVRVEPDRADVREVRAPEDAVDADRLDRAGGERVVDDAVPDPAFHVVGRLHLELRQLETVSEIVLHLVDAPHEVGDP